MHFAVALPWWGYVLAFACAVALAWPAYARAAVPLEPSQRAACSSRCGRSRSPSSSRACCARWRCCRPDRARSTRSCPCSSMSRAACGSPTATARRASSAAQASSRAVADGSGATIASDVLTFGEALGAPALDEPRRHGAGVAISPGALAAVADRYRDGPLAGIVLVSDGGDTASDGGAARGRWPAPVFTVGVGDAAAGTRSRDRQPHRGEPLLAERVVDLSVSAVSHGLRHAIRCEFRVQRQWPAGRRAPASRRRPTAPRCTRCSPCRPRPTRATVYTRRDPADPGELSPENNRRSVLVAAARPAAAHARGRRRAGIRAHVPEARAGTDPGSMSTPSSARARTTSGATPSSCRPAPAARRRWPAAIPAHARPSSSPTTASCFGNVEADLFTRDQLALTAAFVGERGGGLLVLGRALVRPPGPVGHAARRGAAARPDGSPRRRARAPPRTRSPAAARPR